MGGSRLALSSVRASDGGEPGNAGFRKKLKIIEMSRKTAPTIVTTLMDFKSSL
jgi:hypothetical protein